MPRTLLPGLVLLALVGCSHLEASDRDGGRVEHRSEWGFTIEVPALWIVVARGTVPALRERFGPQLAGAEEAGLDREDLERTLARAESGTAEHLFAPDGTGGYMNHVGVTELELRFPRTDGELADLCSKRKGIIGGALGRELTQRRCQYIELDGRWTVWSVFETPGIWAQVAVVDLGSGRAVDLLAVGWADPEDPFRLELAEALASWRFDDPEWPSSPGRLAERPSWLFPADGCPADVMPERNHWEEFSSAYCVDRDLCLDECELGRVQSCYALAHALEEEGADPVPVQALFLRACSLGVPSGCTNRAAGIMKNTARTAQDERCARASFEKTCVAGDPWGCAMFGALLGHGVGGERDVERSLGMLERGCRLGPGGDACNYARRAEREIREQRDDAAPEPAPRAPATP